MTALLEVSKRRSEVHGTGLFTDAPVAPFAVVGKFEGTLSEDPADHTHVLWLRDDLGLDVENELRYVNHSDDPNCESVVLTGDVALLVSLRPIAAGEELTMDYGEGWESA